MGFLTDPEIGSLRLEKMILHVVGGGAFARQPKRKVDKTLAPFFLERIKDTAVSSVYSFDPGSATKTQLEKMASKPNTFEAVGQALSREFSRLHGARTLEGAFFIFELGVQDPDVRLYSLVKYDYRQAIEQMPPSKGGLLRLIMHAFISDKKAIQKAALVRVRKGVADEPVAALDRIRPSPEIGDYFAQFLGVSRARNDTELSRQVVEVLRATLSESEPVLPQRNVALAFREAKNTLRALPEIDEAAISAAVLAAAGHPADPAIRTELDSGTRRKIHSAKLDGLRFAPDRQVLDRPAMRQIRTSEGVTLLYPDTLDDEFIRRSPRAGGGEIITIETEEVTEDRVVRDSPSRAARPASQGEARAS